MEAAPPRPPLVMRLNLVVGVTSNGTERRMDFECSQSLCCTSALTIPPPNLFVQYQGTPREPKNDCKDDLPTKRQSSFALAVIDAMGACCPPQVPSKVKLRTVIQPQYVPKVSTTSTVTSSPTSGASSSGVKVITSSTSWFGSMRRLLSAHMPVARCQIAMPRKPLGELVPEKSAIWPATVSTAPVPPLVVMLRRVVEVTMKGEDLRIDLWWLLSRLSSAVLIKPPP
mmetsp:Transcript_67120/g.169465  ORF Transcript_67120/g.169465 Transcript_67120/m.169465 type:complete len:227 (-) Transcript_67120:166-846(-)